MKSEELSLLDTANILSIPNRLSGILSLNFIQMQAKSLLTFNLYLNRNQTEASMICNNFTNLLIRD